uniref:Uncharacterized protein n=1 Tax=Micrurus paraensis TaxID=1970185 RepID=A0A2D4KFT7_9SAUR
MCGWGVWDVLMYEISGSARFKAPFMAILHFLNTQRVTISLPGTMTSRYCNCVGGHNMQSASKSLPIHAAQISFSQNTRNRLYTMNTLQEMEPIIINIIA